MLYRAKEAHELGRVFSLLLEKKNTGCSVLHLVFPYKYIFPQRFSNEQCTQAQNGSTYILQKRLYRFGSIESQHLHGAERIGVTSLQLCGKHLDITLGYL